MEFRHLRYFVEVANTLHFRKAAENLFISQPPLSRQIKQLEVELGVQLFHRTKKKVELTGEGEYLLTESVKLLYQIEFIKSSVKQIAAGKEGQIKIGYVGAVMHCILPGILMKLKHEFPDITTHLTELGNEDQIQALRNGDIDVGFLRTVVNAKGLNSISVFEETFSLILPKDHPYATSEIKNLKQLADEPFIGFSKSCGPQLIDSVFRICSKAGFYPRVVHESSQLNSIVRLVESGLGYSIVPSSVKHGYSLNVKFIELANYKERAELVMVYHKENIKPIIENFIKLSIDN